jgi:hypothetical protein
MRGLNAPAIRRRTRVCRGGSMLTRNSGLEPAGLATGPPGRAAASRLNLGSESTCRTTWYPSASQTS